MKLLRNTYICTTCMKTSKKRKYLYRRQIRHGILMKQKKFMKQKKLQKLFSRHREQYSKKMKWLKTLTLPLKQLRKKKTLETFKTYVKTYKFKKRTTSTEIQSFTRKEK